MDTKALRQKVLDLAIRGKLVPQDPNDEPASVLLERIRQEKQQMVQDGKLKPKDIKNDSVIFKGDDNLHYEKFADGTVKCIEDEIPFEIPDSWAWSRLSSISSNIFAGGDRPSDYSLTKTDVNKYPIFSNGVKENGLYGYCSNPRVTEPSVTVSARGTIGFSCVRMEPFTPIIRLITITPISGYSVAFLNSIFGRLLETGTGSSIPQLTVPNTVNKLIPVPPANEQNKISKAIGEYSNYCNYIDTQENEIHELTKELKAKILDLAIRGKLVPQDPEDEPASVLLERIREEKEELIKQGKIKRDKNESVIFKGDDNSYYEVIGDKRIQIDEEIHFDIPVEWAWTRLGTVFLHNTGKALNSSNSEGTLLEYITTSNLYWDSFELGSVKTMLFKNSEIEKCTVKRGDLLVCEGGDIGRAAIWNYDYDMRIQNHIHRLRPYIPLNIRFFYYLFYYYKINGFIAGQGIGLQGLSSKKLHKLLIPLPPLNIQNKIVCEIDNSFRLLESI